MKDLNDVNATPELESLLKGFLGNMFVHILREQGKGKLMYNKEGKLQDRRVMLKIKLKSLAAESKIIREQEKKTHGQLRNELHLHRITAVRSEARHTHIAYGLIKGKKLDQIEKQGSTPIEWERVKKMIQRYGPVLLTDRLALLAQCVSS